MVEHDAAVEASIARLRLVHEDLLGRQVHLFTSFLNTFPRLPQPLATPSLSRAGSVLQSRAGSVLQPQAGSSSQPRAGSSSQPRAGPSSQPRAGPSQPRAGPSTNVMAPFEALVTGRGPEPLPSQHPGGLFYTRHNAAIPGSTMGPPPLTPQDQRTSTVSVKRQIKVARYDSPSSADGHDPNLAPPLPLSHPTPTRLIPSISAPSISGTFAEAPEEEFPLPALGHSWPPTGMDPTNDFGIADFNAIQAHMGPPIPPTNNDIFIFDSSACVMWTDDADLSAYLDNFVAPSTETAGASSSQLPNFMASSSSLTGWDGTPTGIQDDSESEAEDGVGAPE